MGRHPINKSSKGKLCHLPWRKNIWALTPLRLSTNSIHTGTNFVRSGMTGVELFFPRGWDLVDWAYLCRCLDRVCVHQFMYSVFNWILWWILFQARWKRRSEILHRPFLFLRVVVPGNGEGRCRKHEKAKKQKEGSLLVPVLAVAQFYDHRILIFCYFVSLLKRRLDRWKIFSLIGWSQSQRLEH